MFTGLIEEVAGVRRIEREQGGARITLAAQRVQEDVKLGDSIAVNGVCLTVVSFSSDSFCVEVVPETLRRTNLGDLRTGDRVNLERALRVGDRLGGHIVAGHIDGTGVLRQRTTEGNAVVLTMAAPQELLPYIAEKGSICVDGVSLTVMDVSADAFRVSIIPHTGEATTLLSAPVGGRLNLETDVIAKYVESLLGAAHQAQAKTPGPQKAEANHARTMELLRNHGFI